MRESVKNWVSLHIGADRQGSREWLTKGSGCQVMTVLSANAIECPLRDGRDAFQTHLLGVSVSHFVLMEGKLSK